MGRTTAVKASWLILSTLLWACGNPRGEGVETALQDPSAQPTAESETVAPLPEHDYQTREGRSLFLHYCAPCHGRSGEGDGFNAYNLQPHPRNLADPAFQSDRSDEDLSQVIRRGGRGSGLSNGMPPWGRTLNDRRIGNLVHYLRTLRQEAQEDDAEE